MRSRSILSTLAFLLLTNSLASTATPVPAEAPAAMVQAAAAPASAPTAPVLAPTATAAAPNATPAAALEAPSPFCAARLSALKPPAFGTAPALTQLSGFNVCGACSQPVCRGAHIGNGCGGYGYSCQNVYGDECTDFTNECYCWRGPLP
jgi:hypothetical protein